MKGQLSTPAPIDRVHGAFRRWLGEEYDLDAIDAVLAAAAVVRLPGDPLWLQVISGPVTRRPLLRVDSRRSRLESGRRAIANTGQETEMRHHLAEVVGEALKAIDPSAVVQLTDEESERLLHAANVVTLCRTAVEFDFKGNVALSHDPEMPTRFAKQLTQVVRGACDVGLSRVALFDN